MKFFQPTLILLTALVHTAVSADLTYSVTATQGGRPITDPAKLRLQPYPPTTERLNNTAVKAPSPPHRGHGAAAPPGLSKRNTVIYSANWCGALQSTPSTNKVTTVSGYFQIPTVTGRTGQSYPQYVAPWVGIDGVDWNTALLQAGVTSSINSAGVQTNWAWLEWIPAGAYNVTSFPVHTGDWIQVTVHATSSTSGTITLYNYDYDTSYTVTLTNGAALGQINAEWILEDPSAGGNVPFARFSDTWFEECAATTANNGNLGISASKLIYMNGNVCQAAVYDDANFYTYSS